MLNDIGNRRAIGRRLGEGHDRDRYGVVHPGSDLDLQLRSRGLYLASNPNSSFFYVLTGIHALHVTGGLGGLARVIRKLKKSVLRKSTLDATSHYWHFMGALWMYLLLLLWMKL